MTSNVEFFCIINEKGEILVIECDYPADTPHFILFRSREAANQVLENHSPGTAKVVKYVRGTND